MTAMLIGGAYVLRGDLNTCDLADVLIERGFITAIEPPGRITREGAERIDAADRLLVPGLVNGHTHGHGGLGKGAVGDRVPLEVFLSASGAINGSRTVEDKRLSATLSAVELVRKGCTAAYDLFVEYPVPSCEGIDAVAEAYAAVGMRAVIAPMMADRTLYEALPGLMEALPPHLQARARQMQAAPHEASIAAAREILSIGAKTATGCVPRFPIPSIAPTHFWSPVPGLPKSATLLCRRTWRRARSRLFWA
jgi:guanine deaminase